MIPSPSPKFVRVRRTQNKIDSIMNDEAATQTNIVTILICMILSLPSQEFKISDAKKPRVIPKFIVVQIKEIVISLNSDSLIRYFS